jgi:hypothetical protein
VSEAGRLGEDEDARLLLLRGFGKRDARREEHGEREDGGAEQRGEPDHVECGWCDERGVREM